MTPAIATTDELIALLERGGATAYFGEPVSVLEHGLQAAWFVQRQHLVDISVTPDLIAAALLHDVGHLLHEEGEDAADRGMDTRHEDLAIEVLGDHFSADVLEPIRLHVAAKRYLCATNPRYAAALSPASVQSLALQGGPMSESEAAAFIAAPRALAALALRHADDAAKVRGLQVPPLSAYRDLLRSLWR